MKRKTMISIVATLTLFLSYTLLVNRKTQKEKYHNIKENKMTYTLPSENLPHEGTWLTWPHSYTYTAEYQHELEDIWIQTTQALHTSEKIHIVAYNKNEQTRIEKLLLANQVDLKQIDFVIAKSDDVWIRDTGPIFVFDKNNKLTIANFNFDGWGRKVQFKYDNQIPIEVGKQKDISAVDIADFVLEGGSVETDGNGTLMASLSSVVSENRNNELSIQQAEKYLSQYLGVTNFIWLDGVIDEDITDAHIDGIARFLDDHTLLTVSKNDFAELYERINMKDYHTLHNAKNKDGVPYEIIELPLTKKNVKGLDYKGSYLNYYIGNSVVLVPIYNDENDAIALEILAQLYPKKKIVPIEVSVLFQYGGMIHCITQQQPINK